MTTNATHKISFLARGRKETKKNWVMLLLPKFKITLHLNYTSTLCMHHIIITQTLNSTHFYNHHLPVIQDILLSRAKRTATNKIESNRIESNYNYNYKYRYKYSRRFLDIIPNFHVDEKD